MADSWRGELPLGGSANQVAAAENTDGRLELFYVGTNNDLYHNSQTAPNSVFWAGEVRFANDSAKQVAVAQNADGRLEIFYVGTDNDLYHNWQTAPNGSVWAGETRYAGNRALSQSLPTNPGGLSCGVSFSGPARAMIEFKGSHFERDVILWAVRWYVAYPISYRQLEEMMAEHGVEVDHATLNRWVLKYVPLLEREFRAHKQPVGLSWRLDETYVRVKGSWKYLYRAIDKAGATVDFLLTAKRDRKAAWRFLRKAMRWNGTPEKITIDKSGANTAAIESHNTETEARIEIRQIKYLNNIVEQDHRAIKRLIRPMLGFKSFWSAAITLAGIELMHMIRKGQLLPTGEVRPAQQFYSLAG